MTASIERRQDAWINLATGIGGPKDKSSGYRFASSYIDQAWYALEELYEEDHIAGRIVDALPEAVFANGVTVDIADPKQKEATLDKLDQLGLEDSVEQAMKWERLSGGSAIFIGVNDGRRFDQPMAEDVIPEVLYLHVFNRWELYPAKFYEDPKDSKFGKPSHYRVSPDDSSMSRYVNSVVVHESRLIKFGGRQTTKRKLIENQYWGQSELVRTYTAIKQYGGVLAGVLAAVSDASQGVYKIRDLLQIIEGGNEAMLQTRFKVIDTLRSSLNAILLDSEGEDYQRITTPLTEMANLIDRFQVNVAAAAVMPVTEIFGVSAAGLNATGENDTRAWYKQVAKSQRKSAKPAMERILRLVFRSKLGPTGGVEPTSWSVKFPPAWSPTALEQVQIKKTKVEMATLAQDIGAVNVHQIARGLFSGSEWDGDIVLTADEIDALRIMANLHGIPKQAVGLPLYPVETDEPADPQLTQDDEGEELAALNPRELAARMTELGVKRCEHGKSNRCQLCGVERHRELLDADGDGNGEWVTAWRAIGARAPAPAQSDPDATDADE